MRRVRVVVDGMVQGVGYRYTLRMVAQQAGVAGWVRNRHDGTVEAEIEGTAAQVGEIVAWMGEGPPGAQVTATRVTEVPVTGQSGFDVRGDR